MKKLHNAINEELLDKLADYAGLQIEESEKETCLTELNGILDFLEEFAEIDVPEISEEANACILREDVVKEGLDADWLKANAEIYNGFVCSARIWDKEQK